MPRKRLGVSKGSAIDSREGNDLFCSEEEEERLYRCVENADLRNMKEILSSGKVRSNKVYRNKELICGEDRIMVVIYLLYIL